MSGVRRFLSGTLIITALTGSIFFLWVSSHHVTPILMYHIISSTDEETANIISPESFKYQMKFIKRRGFKVLSLDDYAKMRQDERKIARRNIILTFDDGHVDLYKNVFPVLKKYEYPAVIYIPSSQVGKKGYLTSTQMKEMAESGLIVFGSHTRNHSYLPDLPAELQVKEIVESKADLEKMLEKKIMHFSYPIGGFSENIKTMVKEAGYITAVTTNRGFDRYNKDFYEYNRISMRNWDTLWGHLFAKLSGYYNLFRKAKSPN